MNLYKYDVAISYASEELALVNLVYKMLDTEGVSVFFAPAEQQDIVGQDQTKVFHLIYGKEARFVAVFVSKHYITKPVCLHEARSEMIRNLDDDYCLIPIYLDGTHLPDLDPDIAYYDENNPYKIKRLIIQKIRNTSGIDDKEKNNQSQSIHIHNGDTIQIGEINGGKVHF